MSSEDRLLRQVEDLLEHGPFRVFDQVFYHGDLFTFAEGGDIGRILKIDEDGEYARVEFPRGTGWAWIGNLTRVPKKKE
jgi:hypothetical protein